jgi:hypothetical protein
VALWSVRGEELLMKNCHVTDEVQGSPSVYMKTKERHVSLLQTRTTLLSGDQCMTDTSRQATALKIMEFRITKKYNGEIYSNEEKIF